MTSKKSLVLVDDEDVLATLKKGLESSNFQVHAFGDPVEALNLIKSSQSPSLLISDIRLPGMNGFELARAVYEHNPDMKIVMLTAFEIDKAEFERVVPLTRIDALVNKPVTIRKLVNTIEAVLAAYQ